jgi:hypothetical protein
MNTLKHALIFLTLLPCIAVAEDTESPSGEATVTQVIDGRGGTATIYDSGSSDIHIIEVGKPTRYYIRGDNGTITDITAAPLGDSSN